MRFERSFLAWLPLVSFWAEGDMLRGWCLPRTSQSARCENVAEMWVRRVRARVSEARSADCLCGLYRQRRATSTEIELGVQAAVAVALA